MLEASSFVSDLKGRIKLSKTIKLIAHHKLVLNKNCN